MAELFHYCGHIISNDESGRFPKSNQQSVQKIITDYLQSFKGIAGFGSLASGADILLAEAMLKLDADLHLVLPFDKDDFIKMSVSGSGKHWIERFETLINHASSLTQVFYNKPVDDSVSFALCTEIAMGLCLSHSPNYHQKKTTSIKQIAIWDEQKTDSVAGTYPDLLRGQKSGFKSSYISSKTPDKIKLFSDNGPIPIQPLDLVVYAQGKMKGFTKKKQLISLDETLAFIDSFLNTDDFIIDLNHDVFGALAEPVIGNISDRAFGHCLFHCNTDLEFQHRDLLIQSIQRLKNRLNNG